MLVISDEKSKKDVKRTKESEVSHTRQGVDTWKRKQGRVINRQTSKCDKPRVRGAGERAEIT